MNDLFEGFEGVKLVEAASDPFADFEGVTLVDQAAPAAGGPLSAFRAKLADPKEYERIKKWAAYHGMTPEDPIVARRLTNTLNFSSYSTLMKLAESGDPDEANRMTPEGNVDGLGLKAALMWFGHAGGAFRRRNAAITARIAAGQELEVGDTRDIGAQIATGLAGVPRPNLRTFKKIEDMTRAEQDASVPKEIIDLVNQYDTPEAPLDARTRAKAIYAAAKSSAAARAKTMEMAKEELALREELTGKTGGFLEKAGVLAAKGMPTVGYGQTFLVGHALTGGIAGAAGLTAAGVKTAAMIGSGVLGGLVAGYDKTSKLLEADVDPDTGEVDKQGTDYDDARLRGYGYGAREAASEIAMGKVLGAVLKGLDKVTGGYVGKALSKGLDAGARQMAKTRIGRGIAELAKGIQRIAGLSALDHPGMEYLEEAYQQWDDKVFAQRPSDTEVPVYVKNVLNEATGEMEQMQVEPGSDEERTAKRMLARYGEKSGYAVAGTRQMTIGEKTKEFAWGDGVNKGFVSWENLTALAEGFALQYVLTLGGGAMHAVQTKRGRRIIDTYLMAAGHTDAELAYMSDERKYKAFDAFYGAEANRDKYAEVFKDAGEWLSLSAQRVVDSERWMRTGEGIKPNFTADLAKEIEAGATTVDDEKSGLSVDYTSTLEGTAFTVRDRDGVLSPMTFNTAEEAQKGAEKMSQMKQGRQMDMEKRAEVATRVAQVFAPGRNVVLVQSDKDMKAAAVAEGADAAQYKSGNPALTTPNGTIILNVAATTSFDELVYNVKHETGHSVADEAGLTKLMAGKTVNWIAAEFQKAKIIAPGKNEREKFVKAVESVRADYAARGVKLGDADAVAEVLSMLQERMTPLFRKKFGDGLVTLLRGKDKSAKNMRDVRRAVALIMYSGREAKVDLYGGPDAWKVPAPAFTGDPIAAAGTETGEKGAVEPAGEAAPEAMPAQGEEAPGAETAPPVAAPEAKPPAAPSPEAVAAAKDIKAAFEAKQKAKAPVEEAAPVETPPEAPKAEAPKSEPPAPATPAPATPVAKMTFPSEEAMLEYVTAHPEETANWTEENFEIVPPPAPAKSDGAPIVPTSEAGRGEAVPPKPEEKRPDAAPFEVEGLKFNGVQRIEGMEDQQVWTDTATGGTFFMPADADKAAVEAHRDSSRKKFEDAKKAEEERLAEAKRKKDAEPILPGVDNEKKEVQNADQERGAEKVAGGEQAGGAEKDGGGDAQGSEAAGTAGKPEGEGLQKRAVEIAEKYAEVEFDRAPRQGSGRFNRGSEYVEIPGVSIGGKRTYLRQSTRGNAKVFYVSREHHGKVLNGMAALMRVKGASETISAVRIIGGGKAPEGSEKWGVSEWATHNQKLVNQHKEGAKPVKPASIKWTPENQIKTVADYIEGLRAPDVFRLLSETPIEHRSAMGAFIREHHRLNRPVIDAMRKAWETLETESPDAPTQPSPAPQVEPPKVEAPPAPAPKMKFASEEEMMRYVSLHPEETANWTEENFEIVPDEKGEAAPAAPEAEQEAAPQAEQEAAPAVAQFEPPKIKYGENTGAYRRRVAAAKAEWDKEQAAKADADKVSPEPRQGIDKVEPTTDAKATEEEAEAKANAETQARVRAIPDAEYAAAPALAVMDVELPAYEARKAAATRTADSKERQAYSTPPPLAAIGAAALASARGDNADAVTVIEPTAGNGGLIAVLGLSEGDKVLANELDEGRAKRLGELFLDATVTQGDYAAEAYQQSVRDAAKDGPRAFLMNPPFGPTDESGYKLEHKIALKTIESAVPGDTLFFIGAAPGRDAMKMPTGALAGVYTAGAFAKFHQELNRRGWKATLHFIADGALYRKMGASFPVEVLLMEKTDGSEMNPHMPMRDLPARYSTWEHIRAAVAEMYDPGAETLGERVANDLNLSGKAEQARAEAQGNAEASSAEVNAARVKEPGKPLRFRLTLPSSFEGMTDEQYQEASNILRGIGSKSVLYTPVADEVVPVLARAVRRWWGADSGEFWRKVRPALQGRGFSKREIEELVAAARFYPEKFGAVANAPRYRLSQDIELGLVTPETGLTLNPFMTKINGKVWDKEFAGKVHNPDQLARHIVSLPAEIAEARIKVADAIAKYLAANPANGFVTGPDFHSMGPALREAFEARWNAARTTDMDPEEGKAQIEYDPLSAVKVASPMKVPRELAGGMAAALSSFDERHPEGIDTFVAEKMRRPMTEKELDGSQIDTLGQALEKIDEGTGFIVGSQTGAGKGRVMASVMDYHILNGRVPIFLTAQAKLFTDIWRDITAIGAQDRFKPLVMNDYKAPKNEDPDSEDADAFSMPLFFTPVRRNSALSEGKLPQGANAIFLTYSQVQNPTANTRRKIDLIKKLLVSGKGALVMDEAHLAAGADSNRGEVLREFADLAKPGVVFSSATFAKRGENMTLYKRAGYSQFFKNDEDMEKALMVGGVPFQQYLAARLTERGFYVRHELDYEGVKFEKLTTIDTLGTPQERTALSQREEQIADVFNQAVRSVIRFGGMVKTVNSRLQKGAPVVNMDGAAFMSSLHNTASFIYTALKAETVANAAVAELRAGRAPVVTLYNTNQALLTEIGLGQNADVGRYLTRISERAVSIQMPDGSSASILTPAGFGELARLVKTQEATMLRDAADALVREARSAADYLREQNLPASPIDRVREIVENAGYQFGEVTRRTLMVQNGVVVRRIRPNPDTVIHQFNQGAPDGSPNMVLLLSSSGSTGLSAHASSDFRNQARRVMFVLQPAWDINEMMQMFGRVNRKNQLSKPIYYLVFTSAAGEQRNAAILMSKLRSLSANTSGVSKAGYGEEVEDALDFMNAFGDKALAELAAERNPVVAAINALRPSTGIRAATSISQFLPVREQEEFIGQIQAKVAALQDNAREAGLHDLEAGDIGRVPLTVEQLLSDSAMRAYEVPVLGRGKILTASEAVAAAQAWQAKHPTMLDDAKAKIDKAIAGTTNPWLKRIYGNTAQVLERALDSIGQVYYVRDDVGRRWFVPIEVRLPPSGTAQTASDWRVKVSFNTIRGVTTIPLSIFSDKILSNAAKSSERNYNETLTRKEDRTIIAGDVAQALIGNIVATGASGTSQIVRALPADGNFSSFVLMMPRGVTVANAKKIVSSRLEKVTDVMDIRGGQRGYLEIDAGRVKVTPTYSSTTGDRTGAVFAFRIATPIKAKSKKITVAEIMRAAGAESRLRDTPDSRGYVTGPYLGVDEANTALKNLAALHPALQATQIVSDEAKVGGQDAVARNAPRFKLPGVTLDAEYADAVARGDMETAQRMVDEAAKAAGYDRETFRGDSMPDDIVVYDPKERREVGIFTTPVREIADVYANKGGRLSNASRRFYVRAPKVLDLTKDNLSTMRWVAKWAESFDEWIDRQTGEEVSAFDILQSGRMFDYEGDWSSERWMDLQATAEIEGYDAVVLPDYDSERGVFPSLVVFDSKNLKLADPATYDDNGDLIPLSRRFDDARADIRFKLPGVKLEAPFPQRPASLKHGNDMNGPEEFMAEIKRFADEMKAWKQAVTVWAESAPRVLPFIHTWTEKDGDRLVGKGIVNVVHFNTRNTENPWRCSYFSHENGVVDTTPNGHSEFKTKGEAVIEASRTGNMRYAPELRFRLAGVKLDAAAEPVFFSQLRRTLEAKMPNRMTVMALRGMINPAKGSGIKADEIEWTGLKDFLDGKNPGDYVTKAEVLEAVKDVEIQEVVKGQTQAELDRQEELTALARLGRDRTPEQDARYEQLARRSRIGKDLDNATKFEQYQLPGGENYRELLLTLPTGGSLAVPTSWNVVRPDDGRLLSEQLTEREAIATAERLGGIVVPIRNHSALSVGQKDMFKSSHWDEPNVLAHVRFNERIATNGDKTLFLEEIQSDWHQAGREKGYAKDTTGWTARLLSAPDAGFNHWQINDAKGNEVTKIVGGTKEAAISKAAEGVPDAPFKDTSKGWARLAFKRMLRWAAENGFDRIAWTTGEQQAERYDLSKHVSMASAISNGDGTYNLIIEDMRGDEVAPYSRSGKKLTPAEMEDTIGKDLAAKLIEGADRNKGKPWPKSAPSNPAFFTLRGLDLKVGGEGMRTFYDQILPSIANDIGKKFGARVEDTKLGTEVDGWAILRDGIPINQDRYATAEQAHTVMRQRGLVGDGYGTSYHDGNVVIAHSLPVTPAMRDSVMRGQPRFKLPGVTLDGGISAPVRVGELRTQAQLENDDPVGFPILDYIRGGNRIIIPRGAIGGKGEYNWFTSIGGLKAFNLAEQKAFFRHPKAALGEKKSRGNIDTLAKELNFDDVETFANAFMAEVERSRALYREQKERQAVRRNALEAFSESPYLAGMKDIGENLGKAVGYVYASLQGEEKATLEMIGDREGTDAVRDYILRQHIDLVALDMIERHAFQMEVESGARDEAPPIIQDRGTLAIDTPVNEKGDTRPVFDQTKESLDVKRARLYAQALQGVPTITDEAAAAHVREALDVGGKMFLRDIAQKLTAERLTGATTRPLDKLQTAIMLWYQTDLDERAKDSDRQAQAAVEAHDLNNLNAVDMMRDSLNRETIDYLNAARQYGSLAGQALQALKLRVDHAFDIVKIYRQAREDIGRELTRAEFEKLKARIDILEKKWNDYVDAATLPDGEGELDTRVVELEKKLADVTAARAAVKTEVDRLEAKKAALEAEYAKQSREATVFSEKKAQLEAQIAGLENEIALRVALNQQVEELQGKVDALQAKLDALDAEYAGASPELLASLEKQLADLTKLHAEKLAAYQKADEEMKTANERLKRVRKLIEKLGKGTKAKIVRRRAIIENAANLYKEFKAEMERAQVEQLKTRWRSSPLPKKALMAFEGVENIIQGLQSMADESVAGRQLIKLGRAHPILFARAFAKSQRIVFHRSGMTDDTGRTLTWKERSDRYYYELDQAQREDPLFDILVRKRGMDWMDITADPTSFDEQQIPIGPLLNDMFPSKATRFITSVLGVSNNHYAGMSNMLRLAVAKHLYNQMSVAKGETPNEDDIYAIVSTVDIFGGRGDTSTKTARAVLDFGRHLLYSPRLALANAQYYRRMFGMLANPRYSRQARKMILMEYVRSGIGYATLSFIARVLSWLLYDDKDQQRFQFRSGHTAYTQLMFGQQRVDITGGQATWDRAVMNFLGGGLIDLLPEWARDVISVIDNGDKLATETGLVITEQYKREKGDYDALGRFARSKLKPLTGMFIDLVRGKNYEGQAAGPRAQPHQPGYDRRYLNLLRSIAPVPLSLQTAGELYMGDPDQGIEPVRNPFLFVNWMSMELLGMLARSLPINAELAQQVAEGYTKNAEELESLKRKQRDIMNDRKMSPEMKEIKARRIQDKLDRLRGL